MPPFNRPKTNILSTATTVEVRDGLTYNVVTTTQEVLTLIDQQAIDNQITNLQAQIDELSQTKQAATSAMQATLSIAQPSQILKVTQ